MQDNKETMKSKTITISLPEEMGKEVEEVAAEEQRTISELFRETFRRYKAHRDLDRLAKKGRAAVKKLRLKPEDFGGPFEQ